MRIVLTAVALCLVAGCSGASEQPKPASSSDEPVGTASLKMLCGEVHAAVDGLVASSPDSQRGFVDQIRRLWDASDAETRDTLDVLVRAAESLKKAGVGSDFYTARDGVHAAVVEVNSACVKLGSPILHAGPH